MSYQPPRAFLGERSGIPERSILGVGSGGKHHGDENGDGSECRLGTPPDYP